jgi:hypothetical protein
MPLVRAPPRAERISAPESHLGALAAAARTESIPPLGWIRFQRRLRLHSSRAYSEKEGGRRATEQGEAMLRAAGPPFRGTTLGNVSRLTGMARASRRHITLSEHAQPPRRKNSE